MKTQILVLLLMCSLGLVTGLQAMDLPQDALQPLETMQKEEVVEAWFTRFAGKATEWAHDQRFREAFCAFCVKLRRVAEGSRAIAVIDELRWNCMTQLLIQLRDGGLPSVQREAAMDVLLEEYKKSWSLWCERTACEDQLIQNGMIIVHYMTQGIAHVQDNGSHRGVFLDTMLFADTSAKLRKVKGCKDEQRFRFLRDRSGCYELFESSVRDLEECSGSVYSSRFTQYRQFMSMAQILGNKEGEGFEKMVAEHFLHFLPTFEEKEDQLHQICLNWLMDMIYALAEAVEDVSQRIAILKGNSHAKIHSSTEDMIEIFNEEQARLCFYDKFYWDFTRSVRDVQNNLEHIFEERNKQYEDAIGHLLIVADDLGYSTIQQEAAHKAIQEKKAWQRRSNAKKEEFEELLNQAGLNLIAQMAKAASEAIKKTNDLGNATGSGVAHPGKAFLERLGRAGESFGRSFQQIAHDIDDFKHNTNNMRDLQRKHNERLASLEKIAGDESLAKGQLEFAEGAIAEEHEKYSRLVGKACRFEEQILSVIGHLDRSPLWFTAQAIARMRQELSERESLNRNTPEVDEREHKMREVLTMMLEQEASLTEYLETRYGMLPPYDVGLTNGQGEIFHTIFKEGIVCAIRTFKKACKDMHALRTRQMQVWTNELKGPMENNGNQDMAALWDQLEVIRKVVAGHYLPTEREIAASCDFIKTTLMLLTRQQVPKEIQFTILMMKVMRNDVMPFCFDQVRRGIAIPHYIGKEIMLWLCDYTIAKIRKTESIPLDPMREEKIRECVREHYTQEDFICDSLLECLG